MQLIYSTSDLASAKEVADMLQRAGISTHVANSNSAQLPGFGARLTPGFVGIWVVNEQDLSAALDVLLAEKLIEAPLPTPQEFAQSSARKWGVLIVLVVTVVFLGLVLSSRP